MGKIILCTGKHAKEPYVFVVSNTSVYSIEEMSYYLYTHIYEMEEDFLEENLIKWIGSDLEMQDLADKLARLKQNNNNLKDIIVTILCSNDYYTEKEIKELVVVLDQIMNLPLIKRRKMRGDYFLKYQMYSHAVAEYQSVLHDSEVRLFSEEEYGNILHNMGITHIRITSFKEAALCFKEAYNLNHNPETLHQYMLTLYLGEELAVFEKERIKYELPEDYKETIGMEVEAVRESATKKLGYQQLDNLMLLKNAGRVNDYYAQIDAILGEWKRIYRRQIEG